MAREGAALAGVAAPQRPAPSVKGANNKAKMTPPTAAAHSKAGGERKYELKVCTNKTCKRQGAKQILRFANALCMENLKVEEAGCLGKCGAGPNIAIIAPTQQVTWIGHVSNPHIFCQLLEAATGISLSEDDIRATELRTTGNASALSGDLEEAVKFWDEAIDLDPSIGLYAIYSNRSHGRLALGDAQGALEDAEMALKLCPPDFLTAHIRKIDALCALKNIPQAMKALIACADEHPEYARTSEYKALKEALEKEMATFL